MKDVLADVANRARTIHAVIANDLAPHGGRLAWHRLRKEAA